MKHLIVPATIVAALPLSSVSAQPVTNSSTPSSDEGAPHQKSAESPQEGIVVTGRRLDLARDAIAPALGAAQYTFDREALNKQPGGTNLTLSKSLLQAPGVTQDSYGTIHVRNEHGNLQYRLNGVIVPESISGFGTTFDPRIASSIQLITGTLPAQYGYRTAGVVNFKTESGRLGDTGEAGIYAGSNGWLEPSAMIQGSSGKLSYFLSESYLRNDIGIENPLPTRDPIHDRTTQFRPFGFVSDVLSDKSRVALFGGSFIGTFQIPNVTGVQQGYYVNGANTADAAQLDQNQRETTHYAVGTYQYAGDQLNVEIAPFVRYSKTEFRPDPNFGDVIINGFADAARLSSLAAGVQADGSEQVGNDHTVRFGLFFQNEHTVSRISSTVLPLAPDCTVVTTCALSTIADQATKTGQVYGLYLQDEWKIGSTLTLNYGARFDVVRAFTHEQQFSPRANLVWTPHPLTTVHIGYARNFTPPPQELIAPAAVALYNGTTKQPENATDDPVKAEREHYFDAGVEQRIPGGLKIGIDAYYKIKRNLLDEGQFGSALILSPFNYAKGYAWGVELSGNYTRGPIDLYANIARGDEKAKDIVSSQYFFAPAELAYIADHYIYTDHSQKWTASGGGSYTIHDGAGTLVPTADFIYASGLRTDDPNGIVPNGGSLRGYFVFNAGIAQNFTALGPFKGLTLRADVLNLFDRQYQIRSGAGVGVGAPQWGQRRGIFAGISKKF